MEKKNAQDYLDGQLLLIDKPLKWTSFQVVNKLRWHIRQAYDLKKIKVGHAGTLDPLATGLLIICTGKMTKQINTFQEQIKTYTGTLELGSTTPSYDLETEIDHRFTTDHITNNIIYETINEFRGEIDQFPPVFSALKKEGKRLYEFARAGENVESKSRKVTIHNSEVLNIKNKAVDFCVTCSKGTYIRSLAHDFGKALKSGAHLTALRRTKIGSYSVENAASIEDFILTLN